MGKQQARKQGSRRQGGEEGESALVDLLDDCKDPASPLGMFVHMQCTGQRME